MILLKLVLEEIILCKLVLKIIKMLNFIGNFNYMFIKNDWLLGWW